MISIVPIFVNIFIILTYIFIVLLIMLQHIFTLQDLASGPMGGAFQKKLVGQNGSLTGCFAIKQETECCNVYKCGR